VFCEGLSSPLPVQEYEGLRSSQAQTTPEDYTPFVSRYFAAEIGQFSQAYFAQLDAECEYFAKVVSYPATQHS
jgi:hypothetical protein